MHGEAGHCILSTSSSRFYCFQFLFVHGMTWMFACSWLMCSPDAKGQEWEGNQMLGIRGRMFGLSWAELILKGKDGWVLRGERYRGWEETRRWKTVSRRCGAGFWGLVPSQEQAHLALPPPLVGWDRLSISSKHRVRHWFLFYLGHCSFGSFRGEQFFNPYILLLSFFILQRLGEM